MANGITGRLSHNSNHRIAVTLCTLETLFPVFVVIITLYGDGCGCDDYDDDDDDDDNNNNNNYYYYYYVTAAVSGLAITSVSYKDI